MKSVLCCICNKKESFETHCAECEIDTCFECCSVIDCTEEEDLFDIDGDVVMLMSGC